MRGGGGKWWEGGRSAREEVVCGEVVGSGGRCVGRDRLTLFGDRPTKLPMNSTKQPNTAELRMKPVRTSPGWMGHNERQQ